MGRYSTGAYTTKECLRLELSHLLQAGIIQKNCKIECPVFSWTGGAKVRIVSNWTRQEKWLKLFYTSTNPMTGEKNDCTLTIDLVTVPSNLGKGEILYFSCPVSGKRCRILYNAYGSMMFKSREAYTHRIYYNSQISSKNYHALERCFDLEKELEQLYKRDYRQTYGGKKTRIAQRVERLEQKLEYWNYISNLSLLSVLNSI